MSAPVFLQDFGTSEPQHVYNAQSLLAVGGCGVFCSRQPENPDPQSGGHQQARFSFSLWLCFIGFCLAHQLTESALLAFLFLLFCFVLLR